MLIGSESEYKNGYLHVPHTGVLKYKMKDTGFVLWMLFIVLVFGLPAFGG